MFHQIFNSTVEVLAQAIDSFSASSISLLIQDLGQSNPAKPSGSGYLSDGVVAAIRKPFSFHHFAELESDHEIKKQQALNI